MNNLFQENKKAFFLLLGLLVVLLLVVYFLFFQPVTKDLKANENERMQLENEVKILEIQIDNNENPDVGEESIENIKLAKKMPLDPELENLILTLEEIEIISDSRFDNISFSYDGSVPQRTIEEEETTDTEETAEQNNVEELEVDIETTEEAPESVIDMEAKPEDLHVITLNMSVTSPDYEHFQTFIQEVEKQERMMMVSSLDFQKPAESELLFTEEPDESIYSDVSITTFYYEE
ncbi:hypothetical protein [Oceanobacillus bengalensis]|uniref:Potassium transporter n=1 Tax=Oceanobacillus bengalensis TaxID=1435466 RepID=A0A494YY67_9BACI|nr:hypothetical protein [Oceanobacillus bengalensis]RKQ14656.1 hypothetical protein D8M05_12510 [Oceanobacillus bengalensis]